MKRFFTTITLLAISLTVFSQGTKPAAAAGAKTKAAETKVYLHELLSPYYSVISQDETIKLKKTICTQFEKELKQYLGLGAAENYKIRTSYVNAGGIMKGYCFFNEVYVNGKSTGASILLGSAPGNPDAFIKVSVEGENIKGVEVTNLKTGDKTTEKLDEPSFNLKDIVNKKIQLLVNKNILSGTEKATQTGFATRPGTDPLEDNLEKKHGVMFISNFYEFQTPGGYTGLIYKHYSEKGNYTNYTYYVTDIKGNTLVKPFIAPNMPKYGEVYELIYITVSDNKSHTLKLAYGVSYQGAIIQQLIAEGYIK